MTADPSAIVAVYEALARHGMNTGSSGNVSQRDGEAMCITPTGITAETLTESRLVHMAFDGQVAGAGTPSSEWAMHAAIYQAFPAAGAIVHTHADACTALACLGEGLPPFHYMVVAFGGSDIRCAPYTTFGTRQLAQLAVTALHERTACLLANHGMVCHAANPAAALASAILLETLARQYLLARSAGDVVLLSPAEIDAARERFRDY